MVSSWMFYFQRNDVNLRNEWNNYTNWPYRTLPQNTEVYSNDDVEGNFPNVHPSNLVFSGFSFTGNFNVQNRKHILETFGIVLDGDYRENLLTRGVYDYIEKYNRTKGNAKDGLYCYNFCLNSHLSEYQPSGAINLSRFKTIELELSTYVPPIDELNSSFDLICDVDGNPVGVRKANWRLYDYNYNMTLLEERYNVISFVGGVAGMMYAK